MSRDGSGNYTLPVGNPVVSGTIIDVNWANPTMADIAQQLNNVVTRDGALGPLVPIPMPDGTQALPGMSFKLAPGTGLWREATKAGYSRFGVAAWYIDSTGLVVPSNITVNSVNSGPLAGFRNRLTNGGFDVWQRGTGFVLTAGLPAYTADCVRVYSGGAGVAITKDTTAFNTPHLVVGGIASSTGVGVGLPVESANLDDLADGPVTFSYEVYSSTVRTVGYNCVYFNTKDGGMGATTTGSTNTSLLTTAVNTWQKVSVTIAALPNGFRNGGNFEALLGNVAAGQTVRLKNFQLEIGSVATPFEFRPYAVELALCQRMGFRLNDSATGYSISGFGYAVTGTQAYVFIPVSTRLRIKPSTVSFTASGWELLNNTTATPYTVTNMSVADYSGAYITLFCTVASGLTAGTIYSLRQSNNSSAILDIFVDS